MFGSRPSLVFSSKPFQHCFRNDILAEQEEANKNKSLHHGSYRMFIMWVHTKLSAGDRRVIPSCCVWKIRNEFPDEFGQTKQIWLISLGKFTGVL